MRMVQVSCYDCGDAELSAEDITVRVCSDNNQDSYHFQCPSCLMVVVKPAEPQIVELLVGAGSHFSTWRLPAELAEPRSGAPVSHDDLLDFHDLVADDLILQVEIAKLLDGE